MNPALQQVLDDFSMAADAAVDRARRRVVDWRIRQMRLNHAATSLAMPMSEPKSFMGVSIDELRSGKADWPTQ